MEWGSLFGRSLAQDWIITPLILMILTLVVNDDNTTKVLTKKSEIDEKKQQLENERKKTKIVPNKMIENESLREIVA
eukprot:CAMPEP_0114583792 /NCGR_PEP_ID=MMETSP0125-20121206/7486_1 /TAXON_ID=485358 ORGANISM="Aristerostoma sp., Strain ATCC 50986" /NCGR_SAMPLE_ID=MMETSP0125 /ASSEMBLY_ACC=CAM_ASM_000245 /LENGTH=76 /DNA_ID=CAMNT_0001777525 /DNA_START=1058 /DNA_END=1288 /DNA_ORIENTATION=+